jgi:hypothetical protein
MQIFADLRHYLGKGKAKIVNIVFCKFSNIFKPLKTIKTNHFTVQVLKFAAYALKMTVYSTAIAQVKDIAVYLWYKSKNNF